MSLGPDPDLAPAPARAVQTVSSSETSDPGRDSSSDEAAKAKLDGMVDEWGKQSFPASDPPSNW